MGIKTANITDASNIPTNEVIGILEKIKFHTTLAYFIINKLKPNIIIVPDAIKLILFPSIWQFEIHILFQTFHLDKKATKNFLSDKYLYLLCHCNS